VKKEKGKELVAGLFSLFPIILTVSIFLLLLAKAFPLLSLKSLPTILFSSAWQPQKGQFGLWPFILGTIWVTITAFILAAPLSILTAIYISDYASGRLKKWLVPVIDLLAGLPSVIYGMWGILLIVPLVGKYLAPIFGTYSSGYCILTAGIVLAVMILPTIVNVSVEVLSAVPADLKEAALALGATRLEVVRFIVLKKSRPGVAAACVLGLSRAFGETLAVMMVVGNVPLTPTSLFSPAYPLPALLANNYGEMLSIPGYEAALNLAAVVLLFMVIIFSLAARLYLNKLEQRID
jgi:phosphate transport system permease protein